MSKKENLNDIKPLSASVDSLVTQPENTICKERWYYADLHFGRGETKTCCLTNGQPLTEEDFQKYGIDAFMNHPDQIERRREKLVGIRHKDCNTCWKLEIAEARSKRLAATPYFKPEEEFVLYQNERGISGNWSDLQKNHSSQALRVEYPKILDISLQNECNMMCTYCNFHYSSRWEKEIIRWGDIREDEKHIHFKKAPPSYMKFFWPWFETIKNHVEQILFIGGEPLIQDDFYEILDQVMASLENSTREKPIEIHITSNFNIPEVHWQRFIKILPELTEKAVLKIECSTEAFGPRAEYIRHGLKWKTLTKNVERLLELNLPQLIFGFHACLNNMSTSSMIELFKYASELEKRYQKPINILENVVMDPARFSVTNLTPDFAHYFFEAADFIDKNLMMDNSYRKNSYVKFLNSFGQSLNKNQGDKSTRVDFYHWISRFDLKRGTNFLNTFPEYTDFWNLCAEEAGAQHLLGQNLQN